MKKILLKFALALAFIGAMFITTTIITSCETREACEINQTGDITIINNTGFTFVFDVDDIGQVSLRDGQSKTYANISAGSHRLYYWDDFYEAWYYNTYTLSVCEEMEYTWSLNKKKSTIRSLISTFIKDGKMETIQEFVLDEER